MPRDPLSCGVYPYTPITFGRDLRTQNLIFKTFTSYQSDANKLLDAPQKIFTSGRGAQGADISALF